MAGREHLDSCFQHSALSYTSSMPLVDVDATVIANRRLSGDYNVLTLAAPAIGVATEPGQFVMVKPGRSTDPLLRRPFSVFEVVRERAGQVTAISILNKRIGRSTSLLFEAGEGDRIQCFGPIGKPFTPVSPPMHAWMVAGGVGLAPFATLAEVLSALGTPTTLFYGARTGAELFYLELFDRLGVKLELATEDGSRGARSRVTGPLDEALRSVPAQTAMVYGCGPEPMLATVARLAARYGQLCEVSVERVMGCGLGGCYSCVVPTRHADGRSHLVRSCLAGPVFDGSEILWD